MIYIYFALFMNKEIQGKNIINEIIMKNLTMIKIK